MTGPSVPTIDPLDERTESMPTIDPLDDRTESMPTIDPLDDRPPSTPTVAPLDEASSTGARGAAAPPADPFDWVTRIGVGGMGEVWRVRDRSLQRTVAAKILRADLLRNEAVRSRFLEEAQCSAQLEHPGIVPVHSLGQLPDGRVYFTMREIRGRTFRDVIADAHLGTVSGAWPMRRLVEAFVKACEAVGYAHARGVVHRDLKPDNIMIGGHGEVLVVDWGLAKVLGSSGMDADPLTEAIVTTRTRGATLVGQVAGTPAYMPPEQAAGLVGRVDARSDVYALGAVLYEILTGRPPYDGSARAILTAVLAGPPEPLASAAASSPFGPPPDELLHACDRAMRRDAEDRHASAVELSADIQAWLDGTRRREQALQIVTEASGLLAEADALRGAAASLDARGTRLLQDVPPAAPEDAKAPGWRLQDEGVRTLRDAARLEAHAEQRLLAALTVDPSLPDAHAALVERQMQHHAAAEGRRAEEDVVRAEAQLRAHADALPPGHPARARALAHLSGHGALTLHTDPPGAEVDLYRYVEQNRRLVPVFERSLGRTPLRAVVVPMGSHLCVVRSPGFADMRYPVRIQRGQHWDGVPPGHDAPETIPLLPEHEVGPDDCYVPAGWFLSGMSPWVSPALPEQDVWVDGWIFRRFPVTTREYRTFLDDLLATGRVEDAERFAPRLRGEAPGTLGAPLLRRTEQGFELPAPDGPNAVLDDAPVMLVDWFGAHAYARWLSARTGQDWGLPRDIAWEKAARGVDGRLYPWGNRFDASWLCMRDSRGDRQAPAPVDTFPVDASVYGVRGLAGNVRDWCAEVFLRGGPTVQGGREVPSESDNVPAAVHLMRGGTWFGDTSIGRTTDRYGMAPYFRYEDTGFRIARRVTAARRS